MRCAMRPLILPAFLITILTFASVGALDDDYDDGDAVGVSPTFGVGQSNDTTQNEQYLPIAKRLNCSNLVLRHKGFKVEETRSDTIFKIQTIQRVSPNQSKNKKTETPNSTTDPTTASPALPTDTFTIPLDLFDGPDNFTDGTFIPLDSFDYFNLPDFNQLDLNSTSELNEHLDSTTGFDQQQQNLATDQQHRNLTTGHNQPHQNLTIGHNKQHQNVTIGHNQQHQMTTERNQHQVTTERNQQHQITTERNEQHQMTTGHGHKRQRFLKVGFQHLRKLIVRNSQRQRNLTSGHDQQHQNLTTGHDQQPRNSTTVRQQENHAKIPGNESSGIADDNRSNNSSRIGANQKVNGTNSTAETVVPECVYAFNDDGSTVRWYEVIAQNGGLPGKVNATRLTPNKKTKVLEPCHRPITNTKPPLGDLLYDYEFMEFEKVYRHEKAFLRFAGTPSEFVDIIGQLVWAPPEADRRYFRLSYRKDDTGFYVYIRRRHRCVFEKNPRTVNCHLVKDFVPCDSAVRTLSAALQASLVG